MQEQPYRQEEPGRWLDDGSWLPEVTVAKLYKHGTVIGSGGFGRVFKYHEGITIAVKDIVYRKESCDAAADDKMLRESEIQSKLHHPNIITLYYAKVERQSLLLVMEYAAGGSLDDVLRKCPPSLSLSVLVDWATQIASGMSYLHKETVAHRDLKPLNVLLKDSYDYPGRKTMKICDFGFARDGHQQTATISDFRGTVMYAAPEVRSDSQRYSTFSDVWSYGVTLWEMLTGEKPYKDIGLVSAEYKHSVDDLPTYRLLVVLLQKCWSYSYSSRPTFEAIVNELGEVSSQKLLDDETQYQDFRRWFADHTAPQKPPFKITNAAFLVKVKCQDVCVTEDGHVLIAADETGLLEFTLHGSHLSRWWPREHTGRDDKVMDVEAVIGQRAAVRLLSGLFILLKRVSGAAGERAWAVERQLQLGYDFSSFSVHNDVLAVSCMCDTQLKFFSLSVLSNQKIVMELEYEIKSVAITERLILTVSNAAVKVRGKWLPVVDARSRSDDSTRRLWRYVLGDSDEVTDVCADDQVVYVAITRKGECKVAAISALHGTELVSNAIVCGTPPRPPIKLSLRKAGQHTELVVLSDHTAVTDGDRGWMVTVHGMVC